MLTRRSAGIGLVSALLAPAAFAAPARTPLPGGGSVILPKRYTPLDRGTDIDSLAAYRNYHSTMAGTRESDGGLVVALATKFDTLERFVRNSRGRMTSRFAHSNESEGRWYGNPQTFPETPGEGPNGPELIGRLQVHVVGWTRVYDAPGTMYAVNDRRGVMVGVWIFDSHGGEKQARRLAEKIAASFEA